MMTNPTLIEPRVYRTSSVDADFATAILGKYGFSSAPYLGRLGLVFRDPETADVSEPEAMQVNLYQFLVQLKLQLQNLQHQESPFLVTKWQTLQKLERLLVQQWQYHPQAPRIPATGGEARRAGASASQDRSVLEAFQKWELQYVRPNVVDKSIQEQAERLDLVRVVRQQMAATLAQELFDRSWGRPPANAGHQDAPGVSALARPQAQVGRAESRRAGSANAGSAGAGNVRAESVFAGSAVAEDAVAGSVFAGSAVADSVRAGSVVVGSTGNSIVGSLMARYFGLTREPGLGAASPMVGASESALAKFGLQPIGPAVFQWHMGVVASAFPDATLPESASAERHARLHLVDRRLAERSNGDSALLVSLLEEQVRRSTRDRVRQETIETLRQQGLPQVQRQNQVEQEASRSVLQRNEPLARRDSRTGVFRHIRSEGQQEELLTLLHSIRRSNAQQRSASAISPMDRQQGTPHQARRDAEQKATTNRPHASQPFSNPASQIHRQSTSQNAPAQRDLQAQRLIAPSPKDARHNATQSSSLTESQQAPRNRISQIDLSTSPSDTARQGGTQHLPSNTANQPGTQQSSNTANQSGVQQSSNTANQSGRQQSANSANQSGVQQSSNTANQPDVQQSSNTANQSGRQQSANSAIQSGVQQSSNTANQSATQQSANTENQAETQQASLDTTMQPHRQGASSFAQRQDFAQGSFSNAIKQDNVQESFGNMASTAWQANGQASSSNSESHASEQAMSSNTASQHNVQEDSSHVASQANVNGDFSNTTGHVGEQESFSHTVLQVDDDGSGSVQRTAELRDAAQTSRPFWQVDSSVGLEVTQQQEDGRSPRLRRIEAQRVNRLGLGSQAPSGLLLTMQPALWSLMQRFVPMGQLASQNATKLPLQFATRQVLEHLLQNRRQGSQELFQSTVQELLQSSVEQVIRQTMRRDERWAERPQVSNRTHPKAEVTTSVVQQQSDHPTIPAFPRTGRHPLAEATILDRIGSLAGLLQIKTLPTKSAQIIRVLQQVTGSDTRSNPLLLLSSQTLHNYAQHRHEQTVRADVNHQRAGTNLSHRISTSEFDTVERTLHEMLTERRLVDRRWVEQRALLQSDSAIRKTPNQTNSAIQRLPYQTNSAAQRVPYQTNSAAQRALYQTDSATQRTPDQTGRVSQRTSDQMDSRSSQRFDDDQLNLVQRYSERASTIEHLIENVRGERTLKQAQTLFNHSIMERTILAGKTILERVGGVISFLKATLPSGGLIQSFAPDARTVNISRPMQLVDRNDANRSGQWENSIDHTVSRDRAVQLAGNTEPRGLIQTLRSILSASPSSPLNQTLRNTFAKQLHEIVQIKSVQQTTLIDRIMRANPFTNDAQSMSALQPARTIINPSVHMTGSTQAHRTIQATRATETHHPIQTSRGTRWHRPAIPDTEMNSSVRAAPTSRTKRTTGNIQPDRVDIQGNRVRPVGSTTATPLGNSVASTVHRNPIASDELIPVALAGNQGTVRNVQASARTNGEGDEGALATGTMPRNRTSGQPALIQRNANSAVTTDTHLANTNSTQATAQRATSNTHLTQATTQRATSNAHLTLATAQRATSNAHLTQATAQRATSNASIAHAPTNDPNASAQMSRTASTGTTPNTHRVRTAWNPGESAPLLPTQPTQRRSRSTAAQDIRVTSSDGRPGALQRIIHRTGQASALTPATEITHAQEAHPVTVPKVAKTSGYPDERTQLDFLRPPKKSEEQNHNATAKSTTSVTTQLAAAAAQVEKTAAVVTASTLSPIEFDRIVSKVYRELERKLKSDLQRRGL